MIKKINNKNLSGIIVLVILALFAYRVTALSVSAKGGDDGGSDSSSNSGSGSNDSSNTTSNTNTAKETENKTETPEPIKAENKTENKTEIETKTELNDTNKVDDNGKDLNKMTESEIELESIKEDAKNIATEAGFTNEIENIEISSGSATTNPIAKVHGRKTGKLLGIFDINVNVDTSIDTKTGKIIESNEPFWLKLLAPFIK